MPDFFPAFCVGLSETLVGYPFMTAKVRIQNGQSWRNLKFHEYYRGVKYPLCSSLAFNLVVFPTHAFVFEKTGNHALAGAVAGVAVTPQAFVIDTLTITRQTNQPVSRGLFHRPRGFVTTLSREMIALACYFDMYYRLRETTGTFVAGGAAGLFNWTMTYPIDVIRTRQVAQRISAWEALQGGQMWKGFRIAAARAIVVNAMSFTVYENTKKIF